MSAYFAGLLPVALSRATIARCAASIAALALAGCATTSATTTAYRYPGDRVATKPQHVAEAVIETEADGLPAQTPPSPRARQMPDDPSEPWSRNYGGINPSRAPIEARDESHDDKPAQKVPQPAIPRDLPPQFRKQLAAAIGAGEDE